MNTKLRRRGWLAVGLAVLTGTALVAMAPKLGFSREIFMKEIAPSVHRLCGGPFRGPCDADVAPIIEQKLREEVEQVHR